MKWSVATSADESAVRANGAPIIESSLELLDEEKLGPGIGGIGGMLSLENSWLSCATSSAFVRLNLVTLRALVIRGCKTDSEHEPSESNGMFSCVSTFEGCLDSEVRWLSSNSA